MFSYKWKIFTIQKQTSSFMCLRMRISCSPSTLAIAINTLANKFAEFFLSISKKLFFWHNKKTIGFLPYFFNKKTKENVLTSFITHYNCRNCNQSVTTTPIADKGLNTLSTLSTLSTPIFQKKIILKKYEENTMYKCF